MMRIIAGGLSDPWRADPNRILNMSLVDRALLEEINETLALHCEKTSAVWFARNCSIVRALGNHV